ncbi:MAG: zf-HC2 domain-containing protein [Lysobacterales bacterium]|jgi:anti-sigma factor RsiW
MTRREINQEMHVGELLSGYLDGELTQQVRQRVEVHLADCDECRESLADLEALRLRMGQSRLSPTGPDHWRESMNDDTVRWTRGIGWLLFLGALLILFGIGVFAFLTDPGTGLAWKLLVSALYLGLGGLFVSVLRQRLVERKSDKYKDVEI